MSIIPKKCCIKYEPPTLILFYELQASGKIHRRSIPIRTAGLDGGNNDNVLNNLMKESRHSKYLKEFKHDQLKRLLKMLAEKKSGLKFDLSENNEDTKEIKGTKGIDIVKDDLNKLDDDHLNQVKEHMNESFEQNQVKPGDSEWKYDVEVDFENQTGGKIESSAWDDDDDDDDDMEF